MAGLADLGKNTIEFAVGFALGHALGPALEPLATTIAQEAFAQDPSRALRPEEAALVAAHDPGKLGFAQGEAAAGGIDGEKLAELVQIALTAPGVGELITMLRRGTIDPAQFAKGLRRSRRDSAFDTATEELQNERLDPAVIATSVQRGTMHDPGLLPVGPPSATGRVPPMPVSSLDTLGEAKAGGVNEERLAVMARNVGLPPAPGELLQLLNRGHIGEVDFYRGVSEGNTRNEWGSFLINLRRHILTPHEYAELRLRGWIDDSAMHAGASLSGMEPADTDLVHELLGRPLTVRAVTTGLARGGTFGGEGAGVPEAYKRAVEQGNLRPEWYSLAYANRFSLPSAFVLRNLLSSGAISSADAEQLFVQSGWPPELAKKVAEHGAGKTAGSAKHLTATQRLAEYEGLLITEAELTGDLKALGYSDADAADFVRLGDARRVAAHRNARVGKIRAQYVNHKLTRDAAAAALGETQIPADAQTLLLDQWDGEREANVAALTPAQVKKAVKSGIYTRDRGLSELEERGYTADDAATLLDE